MQVSQPCRWGRVSPVYGCSKYLREKPRLGGHVFAGDTAAQEKLSRSLTDDEEFSAGLSLQTGRGDSVTVSCSTGRP